MIFHRALAKKRVTLHATEMGIHQQAHLNGFPFFEIAQSIILHTLDFIGKVRLIDQQNPRSHSYHLSVNK